MQNQTMNRTCPTCGNTIRGRSDKKFCDDSCRSNYNNQFKSEENDCIRDINGALKKNRKILRELLSGATAIIKTTRENLLERGFRFRYFTHTYTNKKGSVYFFCYDYGYLPLDKDLFLIVKKKDES
jgi:hypothetical protein